MADVLAHHYSAALSLARSAGHTDQATTLEAPALRFLTLAGERALGLDTAAALTHFERALALSPPGHPERADLLARFGQAALQAGRYANAAKALDEAISTFRARGDVPAASNAMVILAMVLHGLGDPRWATLPTEAAALLEPLPPSRGLIAALTGLALAETLQGISESAIAHAGQALTLAEQLGLDRPARALSLRGWVRANLGARAGLTDFREAIVLATTAGQGRDVVLLHNNLAEQVWGFDGPEAALEVMRAGIAFAKAHGLTEAANVTTASTLHPLINRGQLDHALDVALGPDVFEGVWARAAQVWVHALRGEAALVADRLDWLETTSRDTRDPQQVVIGLGSTALARAALGQPEAASALVTEVETTAGARESAYYAPVLPALVRTTLTLGHPDLAKRLVSGVEPRHPYTEIALTTANAALAEAHGDLASAALAYAEAALRWEQFGVIPEHAFALLGQGRCQVRLGRVRDATTVLRQARAIFEQLGAQPALAETDALLGQAAAPGS
jgi:tetratricopeptide (TPR) repeat protein